MLMLFLLIYDGEFLILVPYALNLKIVSAEVFICILIFIVWIIAALLFDICFGALEWQINAGFNAKLCF